MTCSLPSPRKASRRKPSVMPDTTAMPDTHMASISGKSKRSIPSGYMYLGIW